MDAAKGTARLTIRDLLIIITVTGVLLGAASMYPNGIWLVLVPGSFYLPYLLVCILVTRNWVLLISAAVVHTAAVLIWPVAMYLAYGYVEEIPLLAAIVIIDLPLLPLYLIADMHPYIALPISIVLGGLMYIVIALALFRLGHAKR